MVTLSTFSKLETPIQYVKGVGPHLSQLLAQKEISTVEDALYFLPRTYEDRKNLKKIKELKVGTRETFFAVIQKISLTPMKHRKLKIFTLTLSDGSGLIYAKWFRFNERYMMTKFKTGMRVVCSGEIKVFQYIKEITHPDIEVIDPPIKESLHFGRIVPIYSLTDGLYQKTLRRIMKNTLAIALPILEDPLPTAIKVRQNLVDLKTSFSEMHFPSSKEIFEALLNQNFEGRRRIVFDEFFFLELGLALQKKDRVQEKTTSFFPSKNFKKKFLSLLPFELTQAQKRAVDEIEENMTHPYPMHRLLQGDVGSGKTLVATLSSLGVLEAGHQVAMMVPTEILAEQHFHNLSLLLSQMNIQTTLLKSDMKENEKKKTIEMIQEGKFQLIIGTHALLESTVQFQKLGLVIIDEQHRFGVEQRLQLKKKGNPHLLVMTATPIPRTLALTVYGDLDLTLMDELPPGRKPVKTRVIREAQRLKLYAFMKKHLSQGRQAYVIYPLIEESEKIDLRDATQMTEHLKNIFSEFNIALLHGRMKSEEKNKIMKDFKENKTRILVSTTVIEVGIDIPNSTLMVIEHAERFGLSQLHQLRGRIGRGDQESYCFLLAHRTSTEESQERLKAMEAFQSGFKIAEVDLSIRGPGEFLGTRQSGLPGFRVANLVQDASILIEARKEAFNLVEKDALLSLPEHLPLKNALKRRWQKRFHFVRAG